MTGPEHYQRGEEHVGYAEELYRHGSDDETAAGRLAAAIAQAHFAAAAAAATAELNACEGPNGGSTVGRSVEAATEWAAALGRKEL